MSHRRRNPSVAKHSVEPASIGRYAHYNPAGTVDDPIRSITQEASDINSKILAARKQKQAGFAKTAEFWAGDAMGGANIADSQNVNYYSYEFPVDAMELPQSRAQELRFYRLAYDRDPIVGRGIDLHTEIPMAKISLDRPKCSSEAFTDYVFDFYQGLINNTQMFQTWIDATREYWGIGEAFLYVEDDPNVSVCDMAQEFADGVAEDDVQKQRANGGNRSYFETDNPAWGSETLGMQTFKTSADKLASKIGFNPLVAIDSKIAKLAGRLAQVVADAEKLQKTAIKKVADEPDPSAGASPEPSAGSPAEPNSPSDTSSPDLDTPPGGGIMPEPMDEGGMGSGGMAPSFGGGGFDSMDESGTGLDAEGMPAPEDPETKKLKKVVQLLEEKKSLLKELQSLHEVRKNDYEMFSHLTNKDYMGFDRIQLLPPENIDIKAGSVFGSEPAVYYKPPEEAKQAYLDNPDTPEDVREALSADGSIPLNSDPCKGSYVLHLARKKAGFEDHGRSVLQRCMRTIIYREKLRQVQTTLASRNMTPKTLVVAPGIAPGEMMALRGHIDEAKADPDYTVVVNYECTWNEIGSEGRLLALDSEWQHTANDLAIGLGFSPDILNGEGLYSNTRTQLEILSTVYLQFRGLVSYLIQEMVFKPIAMKKGFYEIDLYGRPRWIYPTVNFGRMALRNTGETYQMLFDLYQKGSIPVDVLLELLDVDPEICKKKLEADLFTVNDSKFNAFLEQLYSNMAGNEWFSKSTDLLDKLQKTLGLKERSVEDSELEGSGEGI